MNYPFELSQLSSTQKDNHNSSLPPSHNRYIHAISYERLSRVFGEAYNFAISEGGLASPFQKVKNRMDSRVEEILTRLRSSRLVCSDETGARVKGA